MLTVVNVVFCMLWVFCVPTFVSSSGKRTEVLYLKVVIAYHSGKTTVLLLDVMYSKMYLHT